MNERRQQNRLAITMPCKAYDPQTGRYVPARTCDVSNGGALIETDRPGGLTPGDRIHLGLGHAPQTGALIRNDSMLRARVLRREDPDTGAVRLALRFDQPTTLLATSELRRAA